MKSEIKWVRQSQRVIRMVSELHRMGYQRLRIMAYEHPNAWRLAIAASEYFSPKNGAVLAIGAFNTEAIYSSASGSSYFEWDDAGSDNARVLAEKFVVRFPRLAAQGRGRDWCYAGWLSELIGALEGGDLLPVSSWELMKDSPEELSFLPIWDVKASNLEWRGSLTVPAPGVMQFPLPPRWTE